MKLLLCEICRTPLAMFDPADLSVPLTGAMSAEVHRPGMPSHVPSQLGRKISYAAVPQKAVQRSAQAAHDGWMD